LNTNHTFITSSLPLAAYLAASGELRMRGSGSRIRSAVIVFEDEQTRGPQVERRFASGAMVNALAFHAQLRVLRRAIVDKVYNARPSDTGRI